MGPWGMGRYVNSAVLLQVESCRPQRPEPTCPLSALQSPAVVPTWRTTFLQVEDGSLDSRKTKWISPDRAPRSRKTQMRLGGDEHLLAKTHGPTDMVATIIKQCHPHDRWKKKMRLNGLPAQATPRHATQEPSCIKASRQGHGSSARSQGGRGAFCLQVPASGADSPCSASGFQVKIPIIPEDDGDRGPIPQDHSGHSTNSSSPTHR